MLTILVFIAYIALMGLCIGYFGFWKVVAFCVLLFVISALIDTYLEKEE